MFSLVSFRPRRFIIVLSIVTIVSTSTFIFYSPIGAPRDKPSIFLQSLSTTCCASSHEVEKEEDGELESTQVPSEPLSVVGTEIEAQLVALVDKDLDDIRLQSSKSKKRRLPDKDGQPTRVLLVATWRSGSTFIGQVLASHPATYSLFEPFSVVTVCPVRGGRLAAKANRILAAIMECKFEKLAERFVHATANEHFLPTSMRSILNCKEMAPLCSDVKFRSNTCRLFPVQVIKTVRYRLDPVQQLLSEPSLESLRVIYLVRDPRAVLNSRWKMDLCTDMNPDCADARILCADLAREFYVARDFEGRYPGRFRILHYETMAHDPFNTTKGLFDFLDLDYTRQTEEFLVNHTMMVNEDHPLSTYKDPKHAASHWLKDLILLNVTLLKHVEDACTEAMELWGYERFTSPRRSNLTKRQRADNTF